MGRDSSVGIATRYGLDSLGIKSQWGARFSAPVQTGPGAGSFPGVKRPGRGADHAPRSKRRGNERVGLYLYSSSGLRGLLWGDPLPLFKLRAILVGKGRHILCVLR